MTKMIKVDLDLPDEVYKSMKLQAKKYKMSVSGYLESLIEKEVKKSFLAYAGTFHLGENASTTIDEGICDEIEGKFQ